MKKKALVLCLIILSLFSVTACSSNSDASSNPLKLEKANRYELLIGLNDANTGKQILETETAKEAIKKTILESVSGVTITISNGSYYVGALIVDENTINCIIYGADDEAINKIVQEINSQFNLTVLVAKSTSEYRLIKP
ncbi:hypothetical protein [Acetobacterium tundrae]|uniref:Uncharacterized protein n=1 Tax=Acetobacterium tundrae TaxID=132932 RepID=A0ABR6WHU4_9FIRM|nr:hypothetical protein [Acetobacterium tundrae]MBC3796021.1 hypothetical protein [Acetobacterium tundrae]